MKQHVTLSTLTLAMLGSVTFSSVATAQTTNAYSSLQGLDVFNAAPVQVADIKKQIAKNLALSLHQINTQVQTQLSEYQDTISLEQLQVGGAAAKLMTEASQYTRALKGLTDNTSNLYQLRIASSQMLTKWQQGEVPLIAFAPKGDDKSWQYVEAFDQHGQLHLLDAHKMPERPVLIVELDAKKTKAEGLEVMKRVFAKQGMMMPSAEMQTNDEAAPISTSVLKKIRLNNDQEPWVSGAAEVYGIVTGVNPSRDEPVLDIVDMPYLDHDGRDYTPNQIIIHWERYRWQAADLLLMEQDDNTNYQELATTFLDIVTQVMRAIPDPNVQGYALIPQLTNQLIKAMPSHWFTNDDDYVDVYYTLFEGQRYNDHMGASGNAKITLEPLTINPR
ncbi:DUF3103 family protein [Pseudoalteromonas sp. McH1-7]|uniref:DUF3103 family protein n=1 Tax=unclassified Pseudoalteromonas TaxID=194690 RepID=UPI001591CACB|nr:MULTISPECIES: DUF3103 family protein [unclassified Pseudoalteromonas]NUZ12131.1 DUF3103 family protein [Pseudoalteromonas sp. McH1-7]USD28794.1 DUF3103 family protein [Pseudoalteromonas sp. SCSIO 43201]